MNMWSNLFTDSKPAPIMATHKRGSSAERMSELTRERSDAAYRKNIAALEKATEGRRTWTIKDVYQQVGMVEDSCRKMHKRLMADGMLDCIKLDTRTSFHLWYWK